jgi:hypothetical protein
MAKGKPPQACRRTTAIRDEGYDPDDPDVVAALDRLRAYAEGARTFRFPERACDLP